MNFREYGKLMESRWEDSTLSERFQMIACDFDNLVYQGGKESPLIGGDCSGTVCGPLYLMGYDIRTTADSLYKYLFIDEVTDYESKTDIMAVFYITQIPREHFGRTVPVGIATHVTPVVGRYVVINAFPMIDFYTAAYVRQWYENRNFKVEWRKLNLKALQKHHKDRDLISGPDLVLRKLRR